MSLSRKSSPSRRFDQQRVADGVAVIVVDVLEIVDVEEGQRKWFGVVVMQQVVDVPLDHPPRRQPGQLVIIGAAEQFVLDRLLLAEVGRTGQQQFCVGDANRPMGVKECPPDLSVGNAFLGHDRAIGAQQFDTGFAATGQFGRGERGVRRGGQQILGGNLQARRCGVVDQQKAAVLVLHRYAGRQHPDDFIQQVQFGVDIALGSGANSCGRSARTDDSSFAVGRKGRKELFAGTLHGRRPSQPLL
jgi:hypothetical protein